VQLNSLLCRGDLSDRQGSARRERIGIESEVVSVFHRFRSQEIVQIKKRMSVKNGRMDIERSSHRPRRLSSRYQPVRGAAGEIRSEMRCFPD
jgi:hypothetical protein